MQYVIVPQAVRRIIPPLLNDFIGSEGHVSRSWAHEAFKQAQILANNQSTLTAIRLGLLPIHIRYPLTDYL